MTFDAIVAGIDRYLRLQDDARRRVMRYDGAPEDSTDSDAGRTVETTAQHAPRLQELAARLPVGSTPLFGDALDSKRAIRAQQAARRGDCGDGPAGLDCDDPADWGR